MIEDDRWACYLCESAKGLNFHALRRSYVTHLIEAGYDELFVQQQVGHEYASTTSLYTHVSADYRSRTVAAALERIARQAASRKDA